MSSLAAWIQRSPIIRWGLRFYAWILAILACTLFADVCFELITGDPWLRQPAGKETSPEERFFPSLALPVFAFGLYRSTGLRSIALRDLLLLSGALATIMAFQADSLAIVSVFLGIAYYLMWVVDKQTTS